MRHAPSIGYRAADSHDEMRPARSKEPSKLRRFFAPGPPRPLTEKGALSDTETISHGGLRAIRRAESDDGS